MVFARLESMLVTRTYTISVVSSAPSATGNSLPVAESLPVKDIRSPEGSVAENRPKDIIDRPVRLMPDVIRDYSQTASVSCLAPLWRTVPRFESNISCFDRLIDILGERKSGRHRAIHPLKDISEQNDRGEGFGLRISRCGRH